MNIYNLSDKIVFSILKDIDRGYLEIIDYYGKIFRFGNRDDSLKTNLRIKKPSFTLNLIRGGSIGFAESYMRDEFETDNLSNLIEIPYYAIEHPIQNVIKNGEMLFGA